jgi:importin-5
MRRAALELLISLSEARPSMVKKCNGWVNGVVRCCLEGMAEIRDEAGEATLHWSNTDDVSVRSIPCFTILTTFSLGFAAV